MVVNRSIKRRETNRQLLNSFYSNLTVQCVPAKDIRSQRAARQERGSLTTSSPNVSATTATYFRTGLNLKYSRSNPWRPLPSVIAYCTMLKFSTQP
jgi:hypothetical protein